MFAESLAHALQATVVDPESSPVDISDDEFIVVENALPKGATIRWAKDRKAVVLVDELNRTETKRALIACVDACIPGYVCVEESLAELKGAIAEVEKGKMFASSACLGVMLANLGELARHFDWKVSGDILLTTREMEVLKLVAEGLSNKEIASRLFVSLYTVKNHVHNILEKTQCSRRHHAVRLAIENRWIYPSNFA
jgi:DNA-binding NarL/FixJ family response regulator